VASLLIKDIGYLATMDVARRELEHASLLIEDQAIAGMGPAETLPATADRVVEGRDLIILPGLVNTHHHLYQNLTRALPAAQDAPLFGWLQTLYPLWGQLTAEAAYVSALVGLAELALSGCTTTTDHLYIYPNDTNLDITIQAAQEIGMRFHPCRGSMSLGETEGGLPPDWVVEDEDDVLADTARVIDRFHDPARYAMCRIAVGPCSPFSVTTELMRRSAELARARRVLLHTHLAETQDEEAFCQRMFGRTPLEYAADTGWLGEDVWYAHGVHFAGDDIATLAATHTGVAHCPGSNMRLGSGIAPIQEMVAQGVRIGLAVDGSASNDAAHLLGEARLAMLLQRVARGADALSARTILELATRGGASLLGRDDIGALAVGMAADLIGFRLDRLEYAGAWRDPLGALLFCHPANVDLSVINGHVVVEAGELRTLELEPVLRRHRQLSAEMAARAQR